MESVVVAKMTGPPREGRRVSARLAKLGEPLDDIVRARVSKEPTLDTVYVLEE
jgi:hypothetical protein